MSVRDGFARLLGTWLREEGAVTKPDYLGAILARTSTTRQRSAWMSPRRWLPMDATLLRPMPRIHPAARLGLLVVLLAIAALAAFVIVSSGRPSLAPYGPAVNGRIGFEADGAIVFANPDGTGRTALALGVTPASGPTFSRDGSRFAFYGANDLFVANADGTAVHAVATGLNLEMEPNAFPGWSPDGRQLVFEALQFGEARTVVANADGSGAVIVAQTTGQSQGFPAWAPDGSLIAFANYPPPGELPSLQVVKPDGTGQRVVIAGVAGKTELQDLQWAPDATHRLAFVRGDGVDSQLFVVDVDDGTTTTILDRPGVTLFGEAWSPDGLRIASNHSDVGSLLVNADGTNVVVLPDARCAGRVDWSPDGSRIICLSSVALGDGEFDFLVIDPDGATPVAHLAVNGSSAGMSGAAFSWQRVAPTTR